MAALVSQSSALSGQPLVRIELDADRDRYILEIVKRHLKIAWPLVLVAIGILLLVRGTGRV